MAEPTEAVEVVAAEEPQLSLRENFRILFKASRAFWMVNMVNFGDGIAYFGILNLLTLFIGQDVGFSEQTTGVAVSFFTGLVTLFMFGGGFISDKLGVRRALTLSLVVVLVGRLFLVGSPLAGGMASMVLWTGLLLMGMAEGVIQPALYAGVKEFTDPRTATIGYSLLYAIMNLGIAAEAFVSPFIREQSGIAGVFWAMIAITVLMIAGNLAFFTRRSRSATAWWNTSSPTRPTCARRGRSSARCRLWMRAFCSSSSFCCPCARSLPTSG